MSQDNPGNIDGTENDGTTADGLPEIPVPPVVPPAVPPVEPPVDGPPVTPPLAPPVATPVTTPDAPPVAPPVGGYAPPAGAPSAPPAYYGTTDPAAPAPYTYPAATKTPILSILSLVAGILSTIGLWILFIPIIGGVLGLVFPAAALVLGYLGKKREPQASKGLWLTGIILGYVGAGLAILSIIGWILIIAINGSSSSYDY